MRLCLLMFLLSVNCWKAEATEKVIESSKSLQDRAESRQAVIASVGATLVALAPILATIIPITFAVYVARLYLFPALAAFGKRRSSIKPLDEFSEIIQNVFNYDEESLTEKQAEILHTLYSKLDGYLKNFLGIPMAKFFSLKNSAVPSLKEGVNPKHRLTSRESLEQFSSKG